MHTCTYYITVSAISPMFCGVRDGQQDSEKFFLQQEGEVSVSELLMPLVNTLHSAFPATFVTGDV